MVLNEGWNPGLVLTGRGGRSNRRTRRRMGRSGLGIEEKLIVEAVETGAGGGGGGGVDEGDKEKKLQSIEKRVDGNEGVVA